MTTQASRTSRLPSVFIGSSSEGREIAEYLQVVLEGYGTCEVTVWSQGVFQASSYTLDALAAHAHQSDFAVLVATPDDALSSRGSDFSAVRDNVIFELGLFFGVLGRERTYVVADHAEGLRLPSDLHGLTWLPYNRRSDGNQRAAVTGAARGVNERINDLGCRIAQTPEVASPAPAQTSSATGHEVALAREVSQLRGNAKAQGWTVKTDSETTLRLISPQARRYVQTWHVDNPALSRVELRWFVAELRAEGLRVNRALRRPLAGVAQPPKPNRQNHRSHLVF